MKYLMIIFIIISHLAIAQELQFVNHFGAFNFAASFDVDLNGNIYISDISENTITKLDSAGKEILSIGGYGWEEQTFDEPVSIFSTTLSVYIADKNNNRIQRFDKDLNFLSLFSGEDDDSDITFAYPTCIEISNIGDLYLLDSDNNRILKINLTGEFQLEIGSNDAGLFTLNNPKSFSIDNEGNLYVLDNNEIKVFDQYGNGQLSFDIKFQPHKIHTFGNNLLYIENSRLIQFDMKERKVVREYSNFQELNGDSITDAKIINNFLLVLTPTKITKYKILY